MERPLERGGPMSASLDVLKSSWTLIPRITKKWSILCTRLKMNEAGCDTRLISIS